MKFIQYNGINNTNRRKSRRFIPETIEFTNDVRQQFKEHIKLLKDSEDNYQMFVSPMFVNSLNQITRGRLSKNHLNTSALITKIQEKIPTTVRSIIRKHINNKVNNSLNMYLVKANIKGVDDGTIMFTNPYFC